MCQSLAQGGRRCAVHHPATLAVKNYAKSFGLEQGQVDFIFKQLMFHSDSETAPTQRQFSSFLNDEEEKADLMPLSAKRNAVIRQLAKARELNQIPNASHFYALKNFKEHSDQMYATLAHKINDWATRNNASLGDTWTKFRQDYSQTVAPTAEEYRRMAQSEMVLDPRSLQVFHRWEQEQEPRREDTPRITRTPTNLRTITSYGYDPEDGRLEVELNDGSGDNTRVYALRNVPQEEYEAFVSAPVQTFNNLRSSHQYEYSDFDEAQSDGYRIYCRDCQQYRLASGHDCPGHPERRSRRVRGVTGERAVRRTRRSRVTTTPPTEPQQIDLDAIIARISPSNRETPLQPPTLPPNIWDREYSGRQHTTIDESDYQLTPSPHGSGHSKMISPDPEKIREKLLRGDIVTFNVGRRIYIRGTGRHEYNDVTQEATASLVNGNATAHVILSDPKCTCEVYQRNHDCTHIHPERQNAYNTRVNRYVRLDVDRAIHAIETPTLSVVDQDIATLPAYTPTNNGSFSEDELNGIAHSLLSRANLNISNGANGGELLQVRIESDHLIPTSRLRVTESSNALIEQLNADQHIREACRYRSELEERQRRNNDRNNLMGTGWELNSNDRQNYLNRFSTHANDGYLRHPDQFLSDYRTAQARVFEPIPFIEGSVTNGALSSTNSGRGFGIEVEIMANSASLRLIRRDMVSQGLATSESMARYHARNDFTHWRMESDCSVDGEIVSPILYDNEESWRQVKQICDIVKQHGGTVDRHTGCHVHIGAIDLSNDQRRGVFNAVIANQDVIRRIATNPASNTHRGSYTAPFTNNDLRGMYETRQAGYYLDRYRMLNMGPTNTLEFRDPDGSLDPGHIQANVMMSAALVEAGRNGNWTGLDASSTRTQRVGDSARRTSRLANLPDDERTLADNISLITTLDALFPDRESRQHILDVAVRNRWQNG